MHITHKKGKSRGGGNKKTFRRRKRKKTEPVGSLLMLESIPVNEDVFNDVVAGKRNYLKIAEENFKPDLIGGGSFIVTVNEKKEIVRDLPIFVIGAFRHHEAEQLMRGLKTKKTKKAPKIDLKPSELFVIIQVPDVEAWQLYCEAITGRKEKSVKSGDRTEVLEK